MANLNKGFDAEFPKPAVALFAHVLFKISLISASDGLATSG